jgi:predicted DNA-binding ribbon-helix-helix protein
MGRDVVTSFRVDEELWHRARVYAVENKITMKELIENLLRMELKENIIKKKLGVEKHGNEGKK